MSDPHAPDADQHTTAASSAGRSLNDRKAAIHVTFEKLAGAAEIAGLASVARDIRTRRMPKLDEERFSLVVLGEFNHGKSTFVNALVGQAITQAGLRSCSGSLVS